ncbi:oligopeptide ABC transporter substrate-binding protein [Bhargavaea beijingensis]|uniref:Oligopeptide ABC transporter substrate-binding protein n=1 Tax=Bhargavaea beijingensis TaxID=426756 RepID=A0A1G7BRH8_9BACL|nr:oligopeptide ABC transporter substrate-binding protein [Bhargavaea beijingensis]MCW1926722.1 ABC transporter substrate-binding protein [Bhargavaea beijingensis]RSK37024.1 oligopeptide ABC transporter substrate-binding protein [Bhargavaea beijingensis]SDE29603.1 peptide/nickel transport system substrate-binding protein [Bhargavaea beijingensis]
MKRKSMLWLFAMILVLSAFLAACGGSGSDGASESDSGDSKKDGEQATGESGEAKKGGTLTYALDAVPEGLYNWAFYGIATDAEIIELFDESLIDYDENLEPVPNIASWETEDNQHFTFKFKEGVKWHNGEELTVNDWVFALETLADPEYDGTRYTNVQTIQGAPEFREGKADSISGLKVVDDYTIEITFDEPRVNNLVNLWSYPMPEKAFEGIPVAEMSASDVVRSKPVGLGPFKVENIVPGESVELVKNEDYWNGDVNLDKIIVRIIDNTATVGALQNGDVDMIAIQPVSGPEVEKLDNVEIVTAPGLSYYYVGFKLGKYDADKREIVEETPKYQDVNLRKAMAHAINREEWIDAFFFGYGKPVNKPVPSAHWIAADDSDVEVYDYDPEKAKELLDKAGYVDKDGDGFREDPKGEKFEVKFSHYATGNPTFESRAKALTQYWEEVGLKSKLEMVEVNLYYDMIEKDDSSIETFFGGWSTGSDPDPSGLWKTDEIWNYPRYNNPESDALLEKALSIEEVGDDKEKRKQIYADWQKLVTEDVPMIFIAELDEIYAKSDKVGGFELDVSGHNSPAEWYLNE